MSWPIPEDIDPECIELCKAINRLPGIETQECCCGHNNNPYRIWFKCKSLGFLTPLLYYMNGCHSGHYGWSVRVKTDCGMCPPYFWIEGPIGAYTEANDIALLINEFIDENLKDDTSESWYRTSREYIPEED